LTGVAFNQAGYSNDTFAGSDGYVFGAGDVYWDVPDSIPDGTQIEIAILDSNSNQVGNFLYGVPSLGHFHFDETDLGGSGIPGYWNAYVKFKGGHPWQTDSSYVSASSDSTFMYQLAPPTDVILSSPSAGNISITWTDADFVPYGYHYIVSTGPDNVANVGDQPLDFSGIPAGDCYVNMYNEPPDSTKYLAGFATSNTVTVE